MKQFSGIHSNKEILGGTPVFVGTRVPAQTFLDYLEAGYSINEYLEEFPTVKKKQVIRFLEELRSQITKTPAHHETATR